ncbi:MAG: hypothetical protein D6772_17235 [Bacteroidetes bacterium]|nr:MAG: hypothetical protein D6772_17235 [Bacteroidota bacterium]
MIKLQIPRKEEPFLSLVDVLTELALAHQVQTVRRLPQPVLTDGSHRVEGIEAIKKYLEEMREELQHWWYCAC